MKLKFKNAQIRSKTIRFGILSFPFSKTVVIDEIIYVGRASLENPYVTRFVLRSVF